MKKYSKTQIRMFEMHMGIMPYIHMMYLNKYFDYNSSLINKLRKVILLLFGDVERYNSEFDNWAKDRTYPSTSDAYARLIELNPKDKKELLDSAIDSLETISGDYHTWHEGFSYSKKRWYENNIVGIAKLLDDNGINPSKHINWLVKEKLLPKLLKYDNK